MGRALTLTVHFLDPQFHGRAGSGAPEWPPSPLRLFQALVAAAAGPARGLPIPGRSREALSWLEALCHKQPPDVIAPEAKAAEHAYRTSVPNNAMDIVARAWSRGSDSTSGDADPRTHRTMKAIQPMLLNEGAAVRYRWSLSAAPDAAEESHLEEITRLARNIVVLGWGVDLVVGDAAVSDEVGGEIAAVGGDKWSPCGASDVVLRVPTTGTLDALVDRHTRVLHRIGEHGAFLAPPPLSAFRNVPYRGPRDKHAPPWVAFALLHPKSGNSAAFDAAARGLTVAGQLRHAAHEAARSAGPEGWSEADLAAVFLGHGEARGEAHVPPEEARISYIPLPSLESRNGETHVGPIRRVLLSASGERGRSALAWAGRALSGQDLVASASGSSSAFLDPISAGEAMVARYTRASSEWTSVTPVVLPGYDDPRRYRRRLGQGPSAETQKSLLDHLFKRTDSLFRKALLQSGIDADVVKNARIEWRDVGFLPGVGHTRRYGIPNHLARFPRHHVYVSFRDDAGEPLRVRGPLVIGGGRFMGLGLLAPADRANKP